MQFKKAVQIVCSNIRARRQAWDEQYSVNISAKSVFEHEAGMQGEIKYKKK